MRRPEHSEGFVSRQKVEYSIVPMYEVLLLISLLVRFIPTVASGRPTTTWFYKTDRKRLFGIEIRDDKCLDSDTKSSEHSSSRHRPGSEDPGGTGKIHHLTQSYSVRKFFIGLASAAFTAWKLIVMSAMTNDNTAASTKSHHSRCIL